MTRFRYVATTEDGRTVKRTADARSESALRAELLRANLAVQTVEVRRPLLTVAPERVSRVDVMHVTRQLGEFVRSGIPLTDSLDTLAGMTTSRKLRDILRDAHEQILGGLTLTDAFARHAAIFPPYYLGVLRSAEMTGRLDLALDQLADYMDRDIEARAKVRSALTYPAIVMLMSIATTIILTTWVLPRFTRFFEALDAELPPTTRALMTISAIAQDWWFLWAGALVIAVALVVAGNRTEVGRLVRDSVLMRTPLVRDVVRFAAVERICRVMSAMVSAGIGLPETLAAAAVGANNRVVARELRTVRERLLEGNGLAAPLAATRSIPPAAVQMLAVGERTGALDAQLRNAARFYERELEHRIKRLTALVEPAVIVGMAVVVGFVALALVSAIYGVFETAPVVQPPPGT